MNTSKAASVVLVLDADMTPALAVTRSLGRYGLTVDVASSSADTLTQHSRYVRQHLCYPDPLTEAAAFRGWVRDRQASAEYRLLFPVTERTATALLPLLDDEVMRPLIALPPSDVLEQALDKERTLALARRLDIPHPQSWLIRDETGLADLSKDLTYPLVVKPARSIGDNGTQHRQLSVSYAFSTDELTAKVRHYLLFGDVLLQQYMAGDGVGIEIIADQGDVLLAFQHRRLHEVPLTGGGSSLRISEALHPGMLEASTRLIAAMGWHGVSMVEFKHDPITDAYSLMEINGRFWGSLPLSIAAGADFPVLLYQLQTGLRLDIPKTTRNDIVARKLSSDIHWLELVLRKEGDPAIVRFPGVGSILKDMFRIFSPRHHFDVQQWGDLKPGLVDLRNILNGYVERVRDRLADRRRDKQQRRAWREWLAEHHPGQVKRILFLCYGNINRSMAAQACFERTTTPACPEVASAGFHAEEGRPADPVMQAIARKSGIDLSGRQSRYVSSDMVAESDLILVMEHAHRQRLVEMHPQAANKTMLLGMLPGCNTQGEIADPYGHTPEVYQTCFSQVNNCVGRLAELICAQ